MLVFPEFFVSLNFQERNDGKTPGNLQSLSRTCWLIWLPVSSQIIEQWSELKEFFKVQALKNDSTAKMLSTLYVDRNLPYMTFLKTILKEV